MRGITGHIWIMVHINPVKHALVKYVANWSYSIFHRLVAGSVYPADWAGGWMTKNSRQAAPFSPAACLRSVHESYANWVPCFIRP